MKRSLSLIGAAGAGLLLAFIGFSIREQLRTGGWAEPAGIAEMLKRAGFSEGDLPPSAGAWARQLAVTLDEMDSMTDPQVQVHFGSRTFDAESDQYAIQWGGTPRNVVKVTAHSGAPLQAGSDAIVPVVFKGVFGNDGSLLRAEAIAYINGPNLLDAGDESARTPPTTSTE